MPRSSTGGPLDQAATAAVRRYVDALRAGPPPASRRLRDAVQRRLREIEDELRAATPMHELRLVQERHDLLAVASWYALEDDFIEVARAYSRRHGITYGTWREIGVSAAVLRRAGLAPAGSGS